MKICDCYYAQRVTIITNKSVKFAQLGLRYFIQFALVLLCVFNETNSLYKFPSVQIQTFLTFQILTIL